MTITNSPPKPSPSRPPNPPPVATNPTSPVATTPAPIATTAPVTAPPAPPVTTPPAATPPTTTSPPPPAPTPAAPPKPPSPPRAPVQPLPPLSRPPSTASQTAARVAAAVQLASAPRPRSRPRPQPVQPFARPRNVVARGGARAPAAMPRPSAPPAPSATPPAAAAAVLKSVAAAPPARLVGAVAAAPKPASKPDVKPAANPAPAPPSPAPSAHVAPQKTSVLSAPSEAPPPRVGADVAVAAHGATAAPPVAAPTRVAGSAEAGRVPKQGAVVKRVGMAQQAQVVNSAPATTRVQPGVPPPAGKPPVVEKDSSATKHTSLPKAAGLVEPAAATKPASVANQPRLAKQASAPGQLQVVKVPVAKTAARKAIAPRATSEDPAPHDAVPAKKAMVANAVESPSTMSAQKTAVTAKVNETSKTAGVPRTGGIPKAGGTLKKGALPKTTTAQKPAQHSSGNGSGQSAGAGTGEKNLGSSKRPRNGGSRSIKERQQKAAMEGPSGGAQRRPDSVSREVFMLTGGITPAPMVPQVPLSEKPTKKKCWVWKEFRNSARKDGLRLKHWVPAGQPEADYTFARFNKPIKMVTYTEKEYDTVVKSLMPLNMAPRDTEGKDGAGNADHADASKAGGTARGTAADGATASSRDPTIRAPTATISGSVPKREPSMRKSSPTPKAAQSAAAATGIPKLATTTMIQSASRPTVNFVPLQEAWTKEETDKLFALCKQFDLRFAVVHDRWPDELKLRSVDELKDRYYSVSKAIIDHRSLLDPKSKHSLPLALQKHCQAINMNPFDYEYECIRKNQLEWQYRRSKAELREEEETVREARRIEGSRKRLAKERQRLAKLLAPAGDIAMSGDGRKGVDQALAAAAVAANMPQKTFPHRKVASGAYARSSMIYTPVTQSSRVSRRIDDALVELGVGTRPTPTSIVVDNFDLLRMDILSFIELQRTVVRKEEDTHLLRVKLAKLRGEATPPPPFGVTLSHKKRRADDVETGSLFGGPPTKQQKLVR